ncbi:Rho GTPase-activating protein 27 [Ceratocystis lukuohia]|uniref:Rho GTPase-activating protein 27 n=1 Tax=Ceratocystis lukuohia TaxID=2019550 RepID=A0ABR4MRV4_9PEZI
MVQNRASLFIEAADSTVDLSQSAGNAGAPANSSDENSGNGNGTADDAGAGTADKVAPEKSPYDRQVERQIAIYTMLNRLKQSIIAAKEFATFLKKRSLLEDDYAQGIKKLCRLTFENINRPDHKQGTFAIAYEGTVTIQDHMADNGMLFAQTLYRMSEELMELATGAERNRKVWKATGLSAEQRVSDLEAAMRKSKNKYDAIADEYERAKTGDIRQSNKMFFKASKSAAQQEEDLLRKTQAADTDYRTRVQTLQSEMSDLMTKSRPEAVSALQVLIRETDSGLAMQMQKFVSYNEKLLLSNGLCVSPVKSEAESNSSLSLRDIVAGINNEKDLSEYLASQYSKLPPSHPVPNYERHPTLGPTPGGMSYQAAPNPPTTSFTPISPPSNSNLRPKSNSNGPLSSNAFQPSNPQNSGSQQSSPAPSHTRNFSISSMLGYEPKPDASTTAGGSQSQSQSQPQSPPAPGQVTQPLAGSQSATATTAPGSAGNQTPMLPSSNSNGSISYSGTSATGPPQLGALSFQSQPNSNMTQFNNPPASPPATSAQMPLSSHLQLQSSINSPATPPANPTATSSSAAPTTRPSSSSPPPPSSSFTSHRPPQSSTSPGPDMRAYAPPPASSPSGNYDPSKRVFGLSLEQLYERDSLAVPMIVIQCLQAVDLYGLSMEGIYRQNGSKAHISRLKNMFDTDSTMPQLDFRVPENFFHDVNSVTGLLKLFLRELPDPLLTRQNHQSLIEAAQIEDDTLRRDTLHAIINSLPDPNYATLRALTLHLHRVMEHSHITRMNSHNLAVIFGPTLMGSSDPSTSVADAGWQIRVVDTLLQNTYQIFDDD